MVAARVGARPAESAGAAMPAMTSPPSAACSRASATSGATGIERARLSGLFARNGKVQAFHRHRRWFSVCRNTGARASDKVMAVYHHRSSFIPAEAAPAARDAEESAVWRALLGLRETRRRGAPLP